MINTSGCEENYIGDKCLQNEVYSSKHKCDVCNKTFCSKQSLNGHIAAIHEGNKPFSCELCSFRSCSKGYLSRHIKVVHDRKIDFICLICETQFTAKNEFQKTC